jgi:hypothetical protein
MKSFQKFKFIEESGSQSEIGISGCDSKKPEGGPVGKVAAPFPEEKRRSCRVTAGAPPTSLA